MQPYFCKEDEPLLMPRDSRDSPMIAGVVYRGGTQQMKATQKHLKKQKSRYPDPSEETDSYSNTSRMNLRFRRPVLKSS